jgi:hypothetical protein
MSSDPDSDVSRRSIFAAAAGATIAAAAVSGQAAQAQA